MSLLEPVLARLDQDADAATGRLCELLRIPSISADPAYAGEVRRAADWLAGQLADIGFAASVRPTDGHPMVVAHYDGPAGADGPHLLYYGHYDVQPPEPLEEWTSPPFEPTVVDGPHGKRVVARGAVDDKGQVMTFIEAFRAWRATHGTLPARITVLLEGEEESGSVSLVPFLKANRDELAADICLVTDTESWSIDTPAITTMLRGLMYVEVTLEGPSHDLHSGLYGGAVINPINALTRVLGDLHDAAGRVRFPGFYDDVAELPAALREQWRSLGFDEAAFLASAGLDRSVGEDGYSVLERVWARPTCDINGVWGGYTGAGAKTVIAARASAKLSCRLVAAQDPERIFAGLRRFFEERTPPGCRWSFQRFGASPAISVPVDSAPLRRTAQALNAIYGRAPVMMGSGGSIPVVGYIRSVLGVDSLLVGFGLDDDRIHSPNEKFELACFRNGMRSHAAILDALTK